MKHLKRINENTDHSEEIKDLFYPIMDMGCDNLRVGTSHNLLNRFRKTPGFRSCTPIAIYEITWDFAIDFGITKYSDLDHYKKKMSIFNDICVETYDVIERLVSMGFELEYYNIDHNRLNKVRFNLDISI